MAWLKALPFKNHVNPSAAPKRWGAHCVRCSPAFPCMPTALQRPADQHCLLTPHPLPLAPVLTSLQSTLCPGTCPLHDHHMKYELHTWCDTPLEHEGTQSCKSVGIMREEHEGRTVPPPRKLRHSARAGELQPGAPA